MNNDNLIDRIINEVDIVDFIGRDIDLEKRGSNYVGLCPFHEDSSPSYTVNREKKFSKCFACNTGGNVITYYQKRNNVTFKEALRVLAKEIGVELSQEKVELNIWHEMNAAIYKYYQMVMQLDQTGQIARDYLNERKITDELSKQFSIGFAPSNRENIIKYLADVNEGVFTNSLGIKYPNGNDFFKSRLIIPIFDDLNRCVGFSGRTLVNEEIKYLNSREDEIFQKRNILYNLNNAKKYSTDELYIVEGFFDVIALAKSGRNNAVALMGTSFTKEHISLIKKYKFKSLTFILDQDDAGQDATIKAANALVKSGITNIKVINFENYKDVDELISNEEEITFNNILEQKQDFFQYRINYLKNKYNLEDIDAKTYFLRESIENLHILSEEKVANLSQYLSKLTGVNQPIIQTMIYKGINTNVRYPEKKKVNNLKGSTPTDDDAVLKYALENRENYNEVLRAISDNRFKFKVYEDLFYILGNYYEQYDEFDFVNMLDFSHGNQEQTKIFTEVSEKKFIDLSKVPIILSGRKTNTASRFFMKKRR